MKLTYVVTAGEYSDYHIMGVFTTEAKAQGFIDNYESNYYDPMIEVLYLDPDEWLPTDLHEYYVTITPDNWPGPAPPGTTQVKREWVPSSRPKRIPTTRPGEHDPYISTMEDEETKSICYIVRQIWAKSETHAAKIASDMVRAHKAVTPR